MVEKSFVIVGAGMGGLATALRLAHRGHKVTILEKTDLVGGRNRPMRVNGCSFDGGPTLMMMRAPFDRLFESVGEKLDDRLKVELLDPSYRVFYRDEARIDATPNQDRMLALIAERFGPEDAEGTRRLLGDLRAMYEQAIPMFVERNFYRPTDFLTPGALLAVLRHGMLGNLAKRIDTYVRDPKLRMLFSFQTMYLGLSPFESPWVYAVLTYMEYGEGIWYPQGGLVQLAQVVADLAVDRGATLRLNAPVCRIEGKRAILETGEEVAADAIIVNADLPYATQTLMGEPPKKRTYSCSGLVMAMDYEGSLPELLHHNVFFGQDFRGNLEQIFSRHELPGDPAFYACVSARSDPDLAPAGHENLFVLVPVSNLEHPWTATDEQTIREAVYARLTREVGFEPERVIGMKSYGPLEYASELNLELGAAFGLSHHFSQSALFRPSNRSRSNPDVYFVGASTVPGNGLPMVLISAELVEQRLEREMGL